MNEYQNKSVKEINGMLHKEHIKSFITDYKCDSATLEITLH